MSFSDWHFKREIIAESYFKTVFSGVVLSTTIFAEEKTGLTSFLIYDLMPCAVKNKHNVVYVDLSNANVPVTAATLMALDRLLLAGNASNVSFNFLKGLFVSNKGIKKKEYYLNSSDCLDTNYFIDNLENHLDLVECKIKTILGKGPLLMIFDHAERLSDPGIVQDFNACLRKIFLENRDRLKPIYATSDMNGWEKVFKNSKSPLNSEGASIHKLPFLDRVFLRDIINNEKLNLDMDEVYQCFALIKFKPGIFLALIAEWHVDSSVKLLDYFLNYSSCNKIQNASVNNEKLEVKYVLHS